MTGKMFSNLEIYSNISYPEDRSEDSTTVLSNFAFKINSCHEKRNPTAHARVFGMMLDVRVSRRVGRSVSDQLGRSES